MALVRHITADLVRAFAVLALVFLSFAHQSPGVAADGHAVLSAAVTASYCGDAPTEQKAHAPCHACRIGGGALPPPCEGIVRLPALAEPAFPPPGIPAHAAAPPGLPEARGPPALA